MSALAREAPDAPPTTPIEWRLSVPGVSSAVPTARRLVRIALGGSPRADDVELIAAELVTNAIRHPRSGDEETAVTLRLLVGPGHVRIEVLDVGLISWIRPAMPDEDQESGRGLLTVDALADRAGHDPVPLGQLSWADVSWLEPRHARNRMTIRQNDVSFRRDRA